VKPDCEKYADPNCSTCKGAGLLDVGGWCHCAKQSQMLEEQARVARTDRCRSGLCSENCTAHTGHNCEVVRLLHEAQRLVQELNQAHLDLAAERAQRIDAEHERNRFRERLAEGRAN
jgi:hypothetical protein